DPLHSTAKRLTGRADLAEDLASFCRKTYKSLINQENGSIQDQTSDKPERCSGCGFRRGVGPASRTARPLAIRSGWQTAPWCHRAEPPDWKLNRKFPEGSECGL